MDQFEYARNVDVRYMDIDTQHIVNNGIYAHYLTEARVGYFEAVAGLIAEEIQNIVVAHLEIDFLKPISRGDEVAVHVNCEDVSESSFTLAYEVRATDEAAARASTVHVMINPETGESQSIPDPLEEALA